MQLSFAKGENASLFSRREVRALCWPGVGANFQNLASDISGQDLCTEPVVDVYWLIENVNPVQPGRAFVFSGPPVHKCSEKLPCTFRRWRQDLRAAERDRSMPRETVHSVEGERCRRWEPTQIILLRALTQGDTAGLCSGREVSEGAARRGAIIGERYCLQQWALIWFGVGSTIWGWRGGAV